MKLKKISYFVPPKDLVDDCLDVFFWSNNLISSERVLIFDLRTLTKLKRYKVALALKPL